MTSGVKLSGEGLAKIVTTLRAEFKDMLKGEEFKDLMKEGIKDVIEENMKEVVSDTVLETFDALFFDEELTGVEMLKQMKLNIEKMAKDVVDMHRAVNALRTEGQGGSSAAISAKMKEICDLVMSGNSWVAIANSIVNDSGFVISLGPIVLLNVRALCTAQSKTLALAHAKEYVKNVARLADTDHAHLLQVILFFAAAAKIGALALQPHAQQPIQAALQRVCSPIFFGLPCTTAVVDDEWKKALADDKKELKAAIDKALDPGQSFDAKAMVSLLNDRRKMATKLLNAVIKDVFTLPDAPLCDILEDPKKPTHEGIQNFVRCLDPTNQARPHPPLTLALTMRRACSVRASELEAHRAAREGREGQSHQGQRIPRLQQCRPADGTRHLQGLL